MRAHTITTRIGRRLRPPAMAVAFAALFVALAGTALSQGTPPPGTPPATCNGLPATIVGTKGSDPHPRIGGTPGPDVIVGLGEGDIISGGPGNDVICGGPGNDVLDGGPAKDTLLGQKGEDILRGARGKDLCVGGPGKDSVSFGPRNGLPAKCEVEKSIERSGLPIH